MKKEYISPEVNVISLASEEKITANDIIDSSQELVDNPFNQ